MPRSSRSAPAPARRPAPRAAPAPAPAPTHSHPPAAPAPQQSGGGGMLAGLGATMAQGFAFGTGSAIAHRAVGAVAGSMSGGSERAPEAAAPAQQQQASVSSSPCVDHQQAFYQCLQQNQGNVNSCQFYFDALQQCQSSASQF